MWGGKSNKLISRTRKRLRITVSLYTDEGQTNSTCVCTKPILTNHCPEALNTIGACRHMATLSCITAQ